MITNITAVVLAGGKSTRMGRDKSLLKIGDLTMIERVVARLSQLFTEIIVVTNNKNQYDMLKNVTFVSDSYPCEERNALVGIYSGLMESKTDYIFAVACDMPFLNTEIITYMSNQIEQFDVIIPFIDDYYQPLHAIYGKKCTPYMLTLLKQENYKILDFYDFVKIRKVRRDEIIGYDRHLETFTNINTINDMNIILNKEKI